MTLFVFKNVLLDYTSGLIVVLAADFLDAVRLAQDEVGWDFPFSMDDLTVIENPTDAAEPFVAYVSGGA